MIKSGTQLEKKIDTNMNPISFAKYSRFMAAFWLSSVHLKNWIRIVPHLSH